MYKVFCDGELIYDPRIKELALLEPKVTLEINNSGSFSFKILSDHPAYDKIKKMVSTIEVFSDEELIFSGRPISEDINFFKQKNISCEGELAYLNDSIQRPSENHDITVRGFLELLIANHNSQVDESKRFTVGAVTVKDSNNSLYRYTNYENTLEAISDKLVDSLGGYVMVRRQNGTRYIDYLESLSDTCTQTIEFGRNLLDYASNIDAADIATRLIPLGGRLEESRYTAIDERLNIASVNNGLDYVQSDDAINTYGIVTKVQEWDDVTDANILKSKGIKYLQSIQWENMVLKVTAVDLHFLDADIERISVGDQILAISKPHGLNKYFPVTKLEIDMFNPANNKITLGTEVDTSISAKANSVETTADNASTFSASSMLQSAKDNASSLIKMATNGFIVLNNDEQGNPKELLIMDTKDPETATRVWRWNVNGLGYSGTGYDGEYGLAMTMDGHFVADAITVDGLEVGKNVKMGSDATISWEKVTNQPSIPSKTSQLTNDSDYKTGPQVTQITKDTVTTSYVNALKVKAGSVDAENISGTTISGKTISGATITGSTITANNSDGVSSIVLDSNGLCSYNTSNNYKGVQIVKDQVKIYSWYDNGNIVGALGSLRNNSGEGKPRIGLWADYWDSLVLGYCTDSNRTNVGTAIKIDGADNGSISFYRNVKTDSSINFYNSSKNINGTLFTSLSDKMCIGFAQNNWVHIGKINGESGVNDASMTIGEFYTDFYNDIRTNRHKINGMRFYCGTKSVYGDGSEYIAFLSNSEINNFFNISSADSSNTFVTASVNSWDSQESWRIINGVMHQNGYWKAKLSGTLTASQYIYISYLVFTFGT